MVLMAASASAAASDHHTAQAKSSPSAAPPAGSATRTRLHSFSFPTTFGWGTHRLLRCSKNGDSAPASASPPKQPHTPSPEKGQETSAGGASRPSRPWNLRTRRSATVAPDASRSEAAGKKAAAAAGGGQALLHPPAPLPVVAKKRGFSVALTREEIVADFIAIRGTAPPRRPKKRPRAVRLELDRLYPGLSLADVNLDSYKIVEEIEGKRFSFGFSAGHISCLELDIDTEENESVLGVQQSGLKREKEISASEIQNGKIIANFQLRKYMKGWG
uniref:Uncharacterized protein n=1 Tax=Oryza nivara TaxID=4536 RepID=A0A0E0HHU7_ORYNI